MHTCVYVHAAYVPADGTHGASGAAENDRLFCASSRLECRIGNDALALEAAATRMIHISTYTYIYIYIRIIYQSNTHIEISDHLSISIQLSGGSNEIPKETYII